MEDRLCRLLNCPLPFCDPSSSSLQKSVDGHDILQCDGDECGQPYHIYCLKPPLHRPFRRARWFCPTCDSNKPIEKVSPGTSLKMTEELRARGLGSPTAARRDPPDSGLSFFQTLFNEGPSHHPLFANTEDSQDDCQGAQPEKCEKAQGPATGQVEV